MILARTNIHGWPRIYNFRLKINSFCLNLINQVDGYMSGHSLSNVSQIPDCTGVPNENDADTSNGGLNKNIIALNNTNKRNYEILWIRVILRILSTLLAIIGVYSMVTSAKIVTITFSKY